MVQRDTLSTFEEVYEEVVGVVAKALYVDEREITMASAFQRDLRADSIDLMDIVFRLEQTFNIQIRHAEIFPDSVFQGDQLFVSEGLVTDAGMRELRSRMPFADFDEFDQDRQQKEIPNLFTVGLVARFVAWRLSLPIAATRPLVQIA